MLVKSDKWNTKGVWLLGVDAIARISGAAIGSSLALSENVTALYLAAFSGIVIYLATSHILPEAHANHATRWTLVSTLAGVAIMWALVSQLESVHVHGHSDSTSHSDSHQEEGTHNEGEDHDEDHAHEDEGK
jgi:ZIP family zinc transporter